MKTIYYVYQLNEKRNKHGNAYVGMTENLTIRAKTWKNNLKLDYIPELIVLYTDTNGQRAFDWEQDKRVEWKWSRERSYRHQKKMRNKAHEAVRKSEKVKQNSRQLGYIQGKKNVESGHLSSIQSLGGKKGGKKGGKIGGKKNVESGHLQSISSLGGKASANKPNSATKIKATCPHCGKTGQKLGMSTWHFDKCKLKPKD